MVHMLVNRKQILLSLLLIPLALYGHAAAQETKSLLLTARGEGTLAVGDEKFKVSSVVVKLMDDDTVEITLVSDITIFVNGTWSSKGELQKEIPLQIIGTATRGGAQGTGKVLLQDDRKSLAALELHIISTSSRKKIEVSFRAK
jgi:hypothetical protein